MLPHAAHVGDGRYNQGPHSSVDAESPPKRQKIAIACNVCKHRKSKCDGARPVCGGCARRSGDQHKCVYRDSAPFEAVHLQSALSATDQARSYLSPTYKIPQEHTPIVSKPANDSLRSLSDLQRQSSVETALSESDINADAVGYVDNWALRVGLLGTSNGASFLQHIRDVADGAEPLNQRRNVSMSDHASRNLRSLGKAKLAQEDPYATEFVLPLRKTADYLLNIYWEYYHSDFPFLDKIQFEKSYNLLWTGSDGVSSDEQMFHCTLNLMLAISCKLDPQAGSKDQSKFADVYFKRARSLLTFNLLDIDRFSLIQALLLMAEYMQSTNMPRKCFRSLGLAIWIAQDLGLHLPKTISSLADVREQELAKRIWHGCILLDRVVAMVFGRAVRIPQDTAAMAPALQSVDDEYFQTPNARSFSQPAKTDFFIQYCKLHYVMADYLPLLYASTLQEAMNSGTESKPRLFTSDMQALFANDDNLERWKNTLPKHLQVSTHINDPESDLAFHRQANMLHLRFLHVRVLSLRLPFTRGTHLLRRLSDDDPFNLQIKHVATTRTLYMCVKTAEQIIDFIHARIFDERLIGTLPPFWYNITYIYTAAAVIIAAHCFLDYIEGRTAPMLAISLQNAYDVLQYYEPTTPAASGCKNALQSTYDKIVPAEGRNIAALAKMTSETGVLADSPLMINSTSLPMAEANGLLFPIFDDQDMDWLNYAANNWDFNLWQ